MALSRWIFSALLAVAALPAAALNLLPTDQGTVVQTSSFLGTDITHDPGSQVAQVRESISSGGLGSSSLLERGYALFEVPAGLAKPLVAQLRFSVNATGFPFGGGSVSVFDVSSAPAAFQVAYAGGTAGDDLFTDLGNGNSYGSVTVVREVLNELSLAFDGQGLADLAAARGGVFAVGFTGGLGSGRFSGPAPLVGIVLEVSVVPEPGSAALALAGLLGLGWVLARRSRR